MTIQNSDKNTIQNHDPFSDRCVSSCQLERFDWLRQEYVNIIGFVFQEYLNIRLRVSRLIENMRQNITYKIVCFGRETSVVKDRINQLF